MLNIKRLKHGTLALMITALFAVPPVCADKPSWAGGGKGVKHVQKEPHGRSAGKSHPDDARPPHATGGPRIAVGRYFEDRQRILVRDYYAAEFHAGRCPPGLAKKHNGCLPPGQAKKWTMGHPLPRNVVFYDLPYELARQFGAPPAGYRFVRLANDILLISIGTGMVVDAIRDLGGW